MIQLPQLDLNPRAIGYLSTWQTAVDSLPTYAERVAEGKSKFGDRNHNRNATFSHIKVILTQMCQGARRCAYCEDSVADEVEHIRPKDLYPEVVFSWGNYLYACGPCNGPKNNQYAVLAGRPKRLVDVTRPDNAPVLPPRSGSPALINPRVEDPLRFLFLDIENTFAFTPRLGLSDLDQIRAEYTIKVLRLNIRDYLPEARRTAFGNYRARLHEYVYHKAMRTPATDLIRHRDELLKVGHQTVWREIQRQQANYPPLRVLFDAAPEALTW